MGLLVRYNHYTHALWHDAYPHTEYNNKHLMGCTPSWSTWHSLAMTRQPGQWWSLSHSTVLELTLQKGCQHEGGNYSAIGHGDLILAGKFTSFSKYFVFTWQATCSNNQKAKLNYTWLRHDQASQFCHSTSYDEKFLISQRHDLQLHNQMWFISTAAITFHCKAVS